MSRVFARHYWVEVNGEKVGDYHGSADDARFFAVVQAAAVRTRDGRIRFKPGAELRSEEIR